MRAVITGTDYIKDTDGSFKAIETNTSVGLSVDVSRYLDIPAFTQFVSDNGFEEIVLIYNSANLQIFDSGIDLEPENENFDKKQKTLMGVLNTTFSGSSVTITSQKLDETAVTIPDVEDSETKLIIRLAFDTTALIDDTYARDNWEFLKLMNDTDPNSIAKTFINDSELGFDSIGTVLRDNGNHPNYCVKKRITPADNNIYPKLYKINTIEELNDLKAGLEGDEYIQEYIFNNDDLLNNKLKVYRSVDMIYGGELDVMNLWVMEHTAIVDVIATPDYDDDNRVQIWDRVRYTTKFNTKTSDIALKLSADEDTKILDVNNQIVKVQDLNVGDSVKSVSIPGMINGGSTQQTLEWIGDVNLILSDSFVTQSQLVSKTETDYFGKIVEFELENGSIFSDTPHAKIMIETEVSESIVSVFREYNNLIIGDTILVWDNQTDTIIKQNIVDIRYSYQNFKAYTLNVEEFDLFLTLEESEGNRYGLLTHNYDYDCQTWYCSAWNYLTPHTRRFCYTGTEIGVCREGEACIRVYSNSPAPSCGAWSGGICNFSGPATLAGFCNGNKPSDTDLKKSIKFLYKTIDGLQVYEFEYKENIKELWMKEKGEDLSGIWCGVLAQELIGTKWETALIKHPNDFYIVDYDKLPKLD